MAEKLAGLMEGLVEGQSRKMLTEAMLNLGNNGRLNGTISIDESLQELAKYGGTDVEKNRGDPLGDGDQSLIYGRKADWLRELWSEGGDVECCAREGKLPAFAFNCMAGNLGECEAELSRCEGNTEMITELLEMRYSLLRFSALFFAVVGYIQLRGGTKRNGEVVDLLIKHGARVDARDVIGKNVIHYICGPLNPEGDGTMLAMADSCIARAKELNLPPLVNMRDRTGAVPLMQAIQCSRVDLVTFLCTKHQADAFIEDNDDCSPESMSRYHPTIHSIVSKSTTKKIAGEIKRTCYHCKSDSENAKACGRCKLVYYCNRGCQRAHWKAGHKDVCGKTTESEGVVITPSKGGETISLLQGGVSGSWKGDAPKGIKYGEEFDIKIQAFETLAACDRAGMLLYNKSKSLMLSVKANNCNDFQKLFDVIHGFQPFAGRKAYFRAKLEERGKLFVSTLQVFVKKW